MYCDKSCYIYLILSQGKTELRGLEDEAEITVPKFITKIQSRAVAEGEPVHFSCRVEPKHDPKLNITWYKNEQELAAGSRFRITQEFGYVALDILYTYPEDEGKEFSAKPYPLTKPFRHRYLP